jgi:hypothetical protein
LVWCFDRYEYRPALRASWTTAPQVCCHRFSDIRRQWDSLCTVAFTLRNDDLASSPVYVVELKLGDFTCPQTQTNKHG